MAGLNYTSTRQPDQIGIDEYPVDAAVGIIAAGAGDAVERSSQAVTVLGQNAASLLAFGVPGTEYEALAAKFLIRASIADTESLLLKNVMFQHAAPDGSGDPDTWEDVPPREMKVDIVALGALPLSDDRIVVGVTAGVQDDITVHTASGGATVNGLFMVRLSRIVRFPESTEDPVQSDSREFFRLQYTPDLTAGATDTADVFLVLAGVGTEPPYRKAEA